NIEVKGITARIVADLDEVEFGGIDRRRAGVNDLSTVKPQLDGSRGATAGRRGSNRNEMPAAGGKTSSATTNQGTAPVVYTNLASTALIGYIYAVIAVGGVAVSSGQTA